MLFAIRRLVAHFVDRIPLRVTLARLFAKNYFVDNKSAIVTQRANRRPTTSVIRAQKWRRPVADYGVNSQDSRDVDEAYRQQ